ncbi:glycoside hydrolase family 25 protein [Altererythrobacter arenosus]|uniref:Glycoside hydrolase family 25 protein n=1 Tax=Altererythrobacter arenosus TaxID=3032592 RepID=A0ABY8FP04_9SPHN|nr:glycoside hydrolase family 25 protein [Altererythrobacter sp. CAU 1644]WFL76000.1 glycoside hydrolase family 25 protein [Altererythrobacter sp. CAU 1644]
MARRKSSLGRKWRLYLVATFALALLAGALWYWWDMQRWAPDEASYPEQGAYVTDLNGLVGFETVRALGGQFVYLRASEGAAAKDARFARNVAAAARAGLKVGALHLFDPCASADAQSANFVTMVPRDADLLPPAITLSGTGESCPEPVSSARVESELMTFINQVEMHAGKQAILKIYPDFEAYYRLAVQIERDLWLVRDRIAPDYGGRPWLLWSANAKRATEASEEKLEWVVVQP